MRLRQRDLKPCTVRERKTIRESDGNTYETWTGDEWDGEEWTIQANIQPAGGRLMAEMYGERLAYMKTAYVEKDTELKETDGVFFDDDSIYKVVAVQVWNTHKVIHLERVVP